MATSFDNTLAALGIKRTGATSAAATAASGKGKGLSEMGSGDFIALLTAQMKNQDPFEPVDNSQMVAQMAQFSSLAGISEMGSTLKGIAAKLNGSTTSEALGFVGKTVLVEGSTAYTRASGGFAGAVELDDAASAVTLSITDATGTVVKTVNLGAQAKGSVSYDWDGTDDRGAAAGEGPFKVTVNARSGNTAVTARPLVWSPVTSVSMPAGSEPVLTLPGIGQVKSSAVRSVG